MLESTERIDSNEERVSSDHSRAVVILAQKEEEKNENDLFSVEVLSFRLGRDENPQETDMGLETVHLAQADVPVESSLDE
jgi:hypothetical protein